MLLDVVRRAAARLAALHVDDGAERALIGAAAAGVETGGAAGGALRALDRHQRDRRAVDARQVGHEIVQRLERARRRVMQDFVEPAFGLAGKQRHAHRLGAVKIRIHAIEHRQHARHMEAADADLDTALAQRLRQIERARELVRLHAGQHHHAGAGGLDHRRQAFGADAGIGFVESVNLDIDVVAENSPLGAILRQTEKRGQRVRRDRRANPLDDIAVVVVMRRLHKQQTELPACGGRLGHRRSHRHIPIGNPHAVETLLRLSRVA